MSFASRSMCRTIAPGLLALLLPAVAHAHVGAGATPGFLAGIAHPAGGLDHLCAMVAVGIWAAQLGGRALWAVPLAFVTMMAGGGIIGQAGIALPFAESGIAASVLLLGVLIATALRLPAGFGAAPALLVGVFALFHGYAHGAAMPVDAAAPAYVAGFVLATAGLHVAGILAARLAQRRAPAALVRHTGLLIAGYGGYLCLT